jgi:dipeptidyl aminopeptidase/acylaminoacyl peptidase/formylglycine-generating enzyme required for sulfatase activity
MKLKLGIAVILAGLAFLASTAQTQAPGEKNAPWKPDDMIYAELAGNFRISPDSRWVVWTKSLPDKEKDTRTSNLFLSSLSEKKEVQLTRGADSISQPRWSPNSQMVAFLSTRALPKPVPDASQSQLWLINPFGGEPWPITEFVRGVQSYEWVDNDTILFSAQEDPALYEQELKRKKDDSRVVDDAAHEPPVRLFRLAVKDKKVTRLTTNEDWIENWSVSRGGRWAVTVHGRDLSFEWDQKTRPQTFLYDFSTGERKQLFMDGKILPSTIRWARDGSGFYVIAPYSTDPRFLMATINKLYFYDMRSEKASEVPLDWENGLANGVQVTSDGFLALLSAGHHFLPARYTRTGTGWTTAAIEGAHAANLTGLIVSDEGEKVVYEYSTASVPAQWYQADLRGAQLRDPVKITDLNPQFKNRTISKSEVIRWKGALDEEVEGILYYPHNYEAGKRYPLITSIHGGPTGVDLDAWTPSWAYPTNLFTQRGAFVLQVNYHGSGNYGLKWAESICCGKYYDLEIPDIEKGVDFLIAQGKVDADRVGTMGWSNGSILSIQLTVTNPDRYKAASCGAGEVEWISDWANVDFGHAFDTYYFGKSPLEDPQLYIQKSPLFKLDRVKAPTLIFFGTEDRNVPTEEGWTHYRALYQMGKPVRFVLFPGEPHGPRKLTHQLRKVEEEMAWFDRYLFKTEKATNEAFKEDSPLGTAFRRRGIQQVGGRYGVAAQAAGARKGAEATLVPELVKRNELEIGRFEVTRGQYAAFDKNYKFDPGTENYPANGIPFEKAQAYVHWLSRLTGQMWRVPNENEVSALYNNRSGENTLDYWAGYALNPKDAARLQKKAAELGGNAPLLTAGGTFRGQGDEGEELIFDLGGNVAEWVVAADGTGKSIGGSADRPADTKIRSGSADSAYIGFRVVRGEPKPEKK